MYSAKSRSLSDLSRRRYIDDVVMAAGSLQAHQRDHELEATYRRHLGV